MTMVQKLVSADSFDARGVLVPAGHVGQFDTEKLNGKEKHLHDVDDFEPAVVEIAAIAPTGPNPRVPQQLPPNAVQGPGGEYLVPGKVLRGEVTDPQEDRITAMGMRDPTLEDKVNDAIGDIMQTAPTGAAPGTEVPAAATSTEGTVAEVTADLGTKTDDQLRDLRAAEEAGQNRKGVISAIDAELEGRSPPTT